MADLGDLPSLAAAVSADLAGAGIAHAISGAAAMAAYGYVRATRDLDVLIAAPQVRIPEVFELLRRRGFQGRDEELIRALRERYVAELRAGPLSVEILVPVLPYHRTLVPRAVRKEVAGVTVPFVSLEDLIVLKLLWRRAKDVADVQALIAAAGAGFDAAYARQTLRSLLPDGDPRHRELEELLARFAGA